MLPAPRQSIASFRIRQIAGPIETRGVVAASEPEGSGLTVWSTTQMSLLARKVIGGILGLAAEEVRVVCPEIAAASAAASTTKNPRSIRGERLGLPLRFRKYCK